MFFGANIITCASAYKEEIMFKVVFGVVLSAIIAAPVHAGQVPVKKNSYNERVILERYNQYIDLIHQASVKSGMEMNEIAAFLKIESTLNNRAINHQFGAKGLYQHLDSTWVKQKRLYAKKMGVSPKANVYNAKASLFVGSAALAAERNMLAKASHRSPSQIKSGDLYLSHLYGYDKALRIINAPRGTKINKIVKINYDCGLKFHKGRRVMTTTEFRNAVNAKMEREKRLFVNATHAYKKNKYSKSSNRKKNPFIAMNKSR